MIAYFDTSAFLKLVVEETGSDQAVEIWRAAETPVSSVLLYPEGRAALALAQRLGRLSPARGRDARAEFEALFADVGLVAASADLLRRAGDFAETHALRGYDAVATRSRPRSWPSDSCPGCGRGSRAGRRRSTILTWCPRPSGWSSPATSPTRHVSIPSAAAWRPTSRWRSVGMSGTSSRKRRHSSAVASSQPLR